MVKYLKIPDEVFEKFINDDANKTRNQTNPKNRGSRQGIIIILFDFDYILKFNIRSNIITTVCRR